MFKPVTLTRGFMKNEDFITELFDNKNCINSSSSSRFLNINEDFKNPLLITISIYLNNLDFNIYI